MVFIRTSTSTTTALSRCTVTINTIVVVVTIIMVSMIILSSVSHGFVLPAIQQHPIQQQQQQQRPRHHHTSVPSSCSLLSCQGREKSMDSINTRYKGIDCSVLEANTNNQDVDDDRTTTTTTTTIDDANSISVSPPPSLWTMEQLDEYAKEVGVVLSFSTLGPGYRSVARAAHDETLILGYVEGFIRPSGKILHLDKMEVFQPIMDRARRTLPSTSSSSSLFNFGGISFGVGLLMGYQCLLYGREQKCTVGEFLAINDEEFQHKRLVRYYRRVGFQVVKYVGDDFRDIPDRLIWGGCGTLMREDVDVLLGKWARLLTLMKDRATTKDDSSKTQQQQQQ